MQSVLKIELLIPKITKTAVHSVPKIKINFLFKLNKTAVQSSTVD